MEADIGIETRIFTVLGLLAACLVDTIVGPFFIVLLRPADALFCRGVVTAA